MKQHLGRIVYLLLMTVMVAGCPSLPQPYRDDAPDELTRPLLDRIILIRPADETATAMVLARAMEAALAELDMPALVRAAADDRAPPLGEVLVCDMTEMPAGGIQLHWVLLDAQGLVLSEEAQLLPPLPQKASPKTLRPWVQSTAQALVKPLMKDERATLPPQNKAGAVEPPTVYVVPLSGLPSDGNHRLYEALKAILAQTGLRLQEKADGAEYVISGRATIAAGGKGQDAVTVTWRLSREPGDVELATISQNGAVPQGQLQKSWAGVAPAIAEAGVSGLLQVIRADQGL